MPISQITANSVGFGSSTTGIQLPTGTTAQRPVSPPAGSSRYNTTTGSIEFYNGTNWVSTNLIPTINSVTGSIYAGAASNLTLSITNATDTITVRFSEGGTVVADVTGVTVTAGSATVAVPAAVYGQTAGDTIAVSVLNSDGTPSSNSLTKTVTALPTGGTIVTSEGYRYHTFTSSSNLVLPSGTSVTAEALIIAGGGGGGSDGGGGGGAGGYLKVTGQSLTTGTYAVSVGAAGAGGVYNASATTNGGNSSFNGNNAIGGGAGGSAAPGAGFTGQSGGSGGGGSRANPGGSGTSGQGFAGGNSTTSQYEGGGGGAGAIGGPGASPAGTAVGGIGKNTDSTWASATSTGVSGYYAGGGGGGYDAAINGVNVGGAGGGGNGGDNSNPAVAGSTNTGGGGGGNTSTGPSYQGLSIRAGAPGGSGIVIVRYPL